MSGCAVARVVLVAVALTLGTTDAPVFAQPARPSPTVLTIHWGPEDFPGTAVLDAAIHDALRGHDNLPINYYAEYLESETFKPEVADPALRDYIQRKFAGRRIDVVVANTTPAFDFALRHRPELFPGVPIVFVAGRLPDGVQTPGVTGVVSDGAFAETLEVALTLHPGVRRVFVVAQAPTVPTYDQAVRTALSRFTSRVDITYVKAKTVPELLTAIKSLPTPSLILFNRFMPVVSDRIVYSDEIARLMAEVSPVPIYASTDLYVGAGIVGGMVRESHMTGTRIGQIARQVLDGTRPEDIPVTKVPLTPVFDWRQVKRWGIDPSTLPAGSEIRFRTPTVWEAYRWYIVGILVIVAAQLILIGALLVQSARRRQAEEAARDGAAQLRDSYERIRQMAGRLIFAQETARAGIAQDLHDDVCQRLVYLNLAVASLKNSSGDLRAPVTQRAFLDLERDTTAVFDGIRRLSHDLHPSSLRILGLTPALNAHCIEVEKRHGVSITFSADSDLGLIDPDVALCLFRIAQEALRNGLIHGHAQEFAVSLTRAGGQVELTITDDGVGFDLPFVRSNGNGLGVVSMEERAHLAGGTLEIITHPGEGTRVRVRVPGATASAVAAS
jgi:signal transduction histidine kinase